LRKGHVWPVPYIACGAARANFGKFDMNKAEYLLFQDEFRRGIKKLEMRLDASEERLKGALKRIEKLEAERVTMAVSTQRVGVEQRRRA